MKPHADIMNNPSSPDSIRYSGQCPLSAETGPRLLIAGGVEGAKIGLGVVLLAGVAAVLIVGGIPMWFRSDKDLQLCLGFPVLGGRLCARIEEYRKSDGSTDNVYSVDGPDPSVKPP